MTVLIFLIIAGAIAAFVTREAFPPSHREADDAEPEDPGSDGPVEYIVDELPSSLLHAAIDEPAAETFERFALIRLVGSLAITGVMIGLLVIAAVKVIVILLQHFAANS